MILSLSEKVRMIMIVMITKKKIDIIEITKKTKNMLPEYLFW